ncbi:MAG: ABC transporter ATP-binding protein [Thermoplasmata archaeon]|nr:ABC transporter ATP-binding protein [Candidatus Sysuiplasma acidicola]
MSEIAIAAHGLVKSYGEIKAVDGLTLNIRRGEVYSLLGPNGAGKTTTIEMLEGLRHPDAGSISILSMDPWKNTLELRKRVGVIPQGFNFIGKITPREAIRHYCILFGVRDNSKELLSLVDLTDMTNVYFEHLSGGQKQKLGLCLAMVNDPEVIFLDEPTTGLDPQARRNMWDVIKRLKSEGKTLLLTTHYLEEAERLADRVGIVDHGRMLAEGTPDDIIREHGNGLYLRISGNPGLASRIRSATGLECTSADGLVDVKIDANENIVNVLRVVESEHAKLDVLELRKEGLEDVFVRMVGKVEAD